MDAERAHALQIVACLDQVSQDGVAAFDREGRCFYWNGAMERLSQVTRARAVGQSARALRSSLALAETVDMNASLNGTPTSIKQLPFSASKKRFCDFSTAPLTIDGAVYGSICLLRDITEQIETRQQIAETESRFCNMADASPVLLWMSGTDGLCTFFNRTWLEFTGRTLEQEIGIGWSEGVHFQDFQSCMDGYLAAFAKRERFAIEYRLRRHDGEYRWIFDQGVPRYAPNGSFAGFIGSCVDITDRRRLQEDLQQQVRGRDEFISIAAHELRTPLMPMRIAVDLLAELAESADAELRTKVEMLDQAVARQTETIEALLDLSRINGGITANDLEPCDLGEVVREVVARFDRRSAPVVMTASARSPGSWDRSKLERVVSNLVTNGVKYGDGRPVEVAVEDHGPRVHVVVRDQGIGIAPEDQKRIFQRFERAVSVTSFSGFGLGLWIARSLVESMGGAICVESTVGRGSTFTVDLPRSVPSA
jgi:PAS domain S-box-containing protein